MDIKKFKKDFAAFSFTQHQMFVTYLQHAKALGYTIEDAIQYVEQEKIKRVAYVEENRQVTRKCPLCPADMILYPVNISPATQTGDPTDHSVFLCNNKDCMNAIYNKETVQELKER